MFSLFRSAPICQGCGGPDATSGLVSLVLSGDGAWSDPRILAYGDDTLLETIVPAGGMLNQEGEYTYGSTLYSVEIPAGTQEVTL